MYSGTITVLIDQEYDNSWKSDNFQLAVRSSPYVLNIITFQVTLFSSSTAAVFHYFMLLPLTPTMFDGSSNVLIDL